MTKETKEKIEITLEIYNNVKAMIKSSNTEDFFIAVKMWFAMDPPMLLSDIIEQEFNAYINQKLMNEGIGKNIKPIKTEIKWHI